MSDPSSMVNDEPPSLSQKELNTLMQTIVRDTERGVFEQLVQVWIEQVVMTVTRAASVAVVPAPANVGPVYALLQSYPEVVTFLREWSETKGELLGVQLGQIARLLLRRELLHEPVSPE